MTRTIYLPPARGNNGASVVHRISEPTRFLVGAKGRGRPVQWEHGKRPDAPVNGSSDLYQFVCDGKRWYALGIVGGVK